MTPIPLSFDALPAAPNGADTAWSLTATAMVVLMTPGLAFFYGGLVRAKNALNTMMMCFSAMGVAGVAWALLGYSLAFAPGTPWIGGLGHAGLAGVGLELHGTVPHVLAMAFQGSFAIVAAALIAGAVVERMRFGPFLAFVGAWVVLVYAPICHWVWGGGWLAELGALDFAGGTVVHVNAGAAAVVAAWVVGPRRDYGRQALLPHDVGHVLLGAGLLWFGWFGFNAGSAAGANASAALAFANTLLAPTATLVVWLALDTWRTGRATAVGVATAIVVGLVAVTPAAGFVAPGSALGLGAFAALPSYFAIHARGRSRLDDSLDVGAAHGVGGISGALLTGLLASPVLAGDAAVAGGLRQTAIQLAGVLAAAAYSGVASWLLLRALAVLAPLRVSARDESRGLDVPLHGEELRGDGEGALLLLPEDAPPSRAPGSIVRAQEHPA